MDKQAYRQPCTDPEVAKAAAAVLEAILLTRSPRDLKALGSLASRLSPVMVQSPWERGRLGICWRLSETAKVYFMPPPFYRHNLRPRWDGEAQVVLVGDATAADAARLLTGLNGLLSNHPPSG